MRPLPEMPERRPMPCKVVVVALAAASCVAATGYAWDAYATLRQSAASARAVLERSTSQDERSGAIVVLLREVNANLAALRAAARADDAAARQASLALGQIEGR